MTDLTQLVKNIASRRGFSADLGQPRHSNSRGLHRSFDMRKPRLKMSTVQIGQGCGGLLFFG
jgi:hypothetical protein